MLKIIAADAYTTDEATGEIVANANSAGGVKTEGDMNFDGIDVLLAGIYLSLKKSINVSNADEMTYYGTVLDDEVKVNLDNVKEKVTIDLGGGDDVLDLSVKQSPTVSISLTKGEGFNADTGALTEAGENLIADAISNGINGLTGTGGDSSSSRLQAVIDGGAGDDEITITLINSTDITTTGDEQPDTTPTGLKFDLDLSATNLTVNGGAGTDTITVNGGMELGLTTVLVSPILQQMMAKTAYLANAAGLPGTEININGGAGDDLVNIDTTAAFSSFRDVNVTVSGGSQYDRVNLTGKLEEYEDNHNNISGDAGLVEMSTLAEITILNDAAAISQLTSDLSVNMAEVEAVTDELANKNTVYINDVLSDTTEFASFTNYVIDEP